MAKYLLSLFVIFVIGCSTMKSWSRMDKLEPETQAYGHAIRWGDYKGAKAFTKNQETELTFEHFKSVKVTSYQEIHREVSDDMFKAAQIVEIKYFYKDKLKEKTIIDRQLWEYDEEDKIWYLTTGLPRFE